jgi:hypothetical protein
MTPSEKNWGNRVTKQKKDITGERNSNIIIKGRKDATQVERINSHFFLSHSITFFFTLLIFSSTFHHIFFTFHHIFHISLARYCYVLRHITTCQFKLFHIF